MKKTLQLITLLGFGLTYGQKTLPLYESFNYAIGTNIIGQGGWTNGSTSAVTGDALIASSPGWLDNGLPTYKGEALAVAKSGDDPELAFTPTAVTGAGTVLYSSFMVSVTNLATSTSGGNPVYINYGTSTASGSAPSYFYAFSFFNGTSSSYTGCVFIRRASSTATDTFYLGIGASNTAPTDADVTWSPTLFKVGDEIVVVTKYDVDNKVATMYVNPTSIATEPTTGGLVSGVRAGAITPDRIRITKNNTATTPFITIDEIRAANNYGQALGGASTLGLSKAEITGLKVYPNPVSNGKLVINSSNNSEKQVTIYNVLGQVKLQTKTSSAEPINVSSLSKGFYLVQITEDGKTQTTKLIVD